MRLLLPLAWMLLACATAGVVALPLRMPTVWGERLSVFSYGLPRPFGWGLLHLPALAFGAATLWWAGTRGAGATRFVAAAALGLLAAAGVSAWDPQFRNWQLHPWTLLLAVDGGWLLLFSPLRRTHPGAAAVPGRATLAVALAALLPVLLLQWYFTQMFSGPKVAMTWLDEQDPTLQHVLVVVDEPPRTVAAGCAMLATLAPDLYPGQGGPGGWPKMHRMLELRLRSAMQLRDQPPLLRYEWNPAAPERGDCRDIGLTPRP